MRFKASIIQMDIALGDKERNINKASSYVKYSLSLGSRFILLPELWTTSYSYSNIHELAEPLNGETVLKLTEMVKPYNAYIIGSIAECSGGDLYNTAHIIGSDGLIGYYRKAHLIKLLDEHLYFKPGNSYGVFNTDIGCIGVAICYDLRFPEFIRGMVLKGAKIIFIPSEWPIQRIHHWRNLIITRAIENQVYVVAANRVGTDGRNVYGGHSMIVDPNGQVLIEAGENIETVLVCDLDLNLIEEVRRSLPLLTDRRPELYIV